MTTTTTSKIRKDFEKELAALTARCDAIRDVIVSLDRLDATSTTRARPRRASRPTSTVRAKAPTQAEQVLTLMDNEPDRSWTLADVVANTPISNKNPARTVISRLLRRGDVATTHDGMFRRSAVIRH